MTKLFNKGGDGAGEIVRVLGLIDNDLDFTKWEPILPLGIRDLQAIIGTAVSYTHLTLPTKA